MKIFKNFTIDFKAILIVLLALLSICFYFSWRHAAKEVVRVSDEYADSLYVYKGKADEAYAARDVLILDKEVLEKTNSELAQEVEKLKATPIVVTKTEVKYVIKDTTAATIDDIGKVTEDIEEYKWTVAEPNGWYNVNGIGTVDYSARVFSNKLTGMSIPASLNLSLIEQDNKLTIVANSDNPYLVIGNIQGAVIDPTESDAIKACFKPKRWGIGPTVGFGFGSDMSLQWWLGVGVHYSLVQF